MNIRLVSIFLLLLTPSCSETPDTPEAVYQAFYVALTEQDWDRAASALSSETLDAFRGVGARLARFVGSKADPLTAFLRGVSADLVRPLRRVEVISREEGAAVLRVTAGPCGEGEQCSVSSVNLRREKGRWVICPELPALFPQKTEGERP